MKQVNKPIKRFMKKCCLLAPNAKYPALELYLTYVNWCLNEGTDVHDQFSFLEMIEETGFRARFFVANRTLKEFAPSQERRSSLSRDAP